MDSPDTKEFRNGLAARLANLQLFAVDEVCRLGAVVQALQIENDRLEQLLKLAEAKSAPHVETSLESQSPGRSELAAEAVSSQIQTPKNDHDDALSPQRINLDLQTASRSLDEDSLRIKTKSRSMHLFRFPVMVSEGDNFEFVKASLRSVTFRRDTNALERYRRHGWAQRIARRSAFETLTLCVIMLNSLWISIDLDLNTEDSSMKPLFVTMDNVFCLYFSFELLIRFLATETRSALLRDGWFMFDSVLVTFMVLETWLLAFILWVSGESAAQGMGNISVLRMFRLLRLTRMAKMVRAIPEVMTIVRGMVASLRSVFIMVVLITALTYIFAIVFKQLAANTDIGEEFYSSVPKGMLTLLIEGILPDNGDMLQGLLDEGWHLGFLFFLFLFLSGLTCMNMLIGFLCDVVSNVTEDEKRCLEIEKMTEQFLKVFKSVDTDQNGLVSKQELKLLLQDTDSISSLQAVGVDVLAMMDELGQTLEEREIPFQDFVDKVLSFRNAQPATVGQVSGFKESIVSQLREIEKRLADLQCSPTPASPLEDYPKRRAHFC